MAADDGVVYPLLEQFNPRFDTRVAARVLSGIRMPAIVVTVMLMSVYRSPFPIASRAQLTGGRPFYPESAWRRLRLRSLRRSRTIVAS